MSSNKIHSKINIFHTLALRICEINSIKLDSSRAFQQHLKPPQISMQFSVSILQCYQLQSLEMIKNLGFNHHGPYLLEKGSIDLFNPTILLWAPRLCQLLFYLGPHCKNDTNLSLTYSPPQLVNGH
jgi:hypothetical protein